MTTFKESAKNGKSLAEIRTVSRFEQLITKSNKCTKKALSMPAGRMRDIWAQKGRELEEMAYALTIEEAGKEAGK